MLSSNVSCLATPAGLCLAELVLACVDDRVTVQATLTADCQAGQAGSLPTTLHTAPPPPSKHSGSDYSVIHGKRGDFSHEKNFLGWNEILY